jgi:hypothetical protein
MDSLTFLSPLAALVALGVAVPLAALLLAERRAAQARSLLRLAPPGLARQAAPAAGILLTAALLGVAAAQPVVRTLDERRVREDAQALFVVDTSRSMLASTRPGATTRFERAQAAAQRLRAQLQEVPTGLASLTDRVLPVVLPTADGRVFSSALTRALEVDSPPPQQRAIRATTLGALRDVVAGRYFPARIERRLVVVFTDGETQPLDSVSLVRALRRGEVLGPLFVHVWRPDELVFGPNGVPEPGYRPDATSGARLDALARSAGSRVFGPGETEAAAGAARRLLGEGSVTLRGREVRSLELAPYAALSALVPLGFLLWRRNLR